MNLTDFLIINTHRQHDSFRNSTGDWLGVHYLSSFLSENGFLSLSFAGYVHEVPPLLDQYMTSHGIRVVGLSCDYENQSVVANLVGYIKERWDVPVIIGGPQTFELGEKFLRETKADLIVYGEGELTTLEVLASLLENGPSLSNIKGIKFIDANGDFIVTPSRPLIKNLDMLPFPNEEYVLGTLFRTNSASFLTGRGCPFSCSFCFEGGTTKGVRQRSVENVITEIESVLEAHPEIKHILFTDDTFTVSLPRLREFCQELKRLKTRFDFTWYCEGHVRILYNDSTIIQEMVDAGMISLQIGIESGCDEILTAYNKEINTEMIKKVIQDAYAADLYQLWGNIILGAAMETKKRIRRNIDFVKELHQLAPGMLNIDVIYYWPLPGTKITSEPDTFQMKIVDPESRSSRMDFPVVQFEELTPFDLCNARTEMATELREAMFKLIPEISVERGLRMISHLQFTKGIGNWLLLLKDYPEFCNFFYLLKNGATVLFEHLADTEIDSCRPIRTYRPEQFDDKQRLVYHGKTLSIEETQILIWSAGKLTIGQLWEQTASLFTSKQQMITCLQHLEKQRLLTFSTL